MSSYQPAIIAKNASFALFVLFKIKKEARTVLSHASRIHSLVDELNQEQANANLQACVAFSAEFCKENHIVTPSDFGAFRPLGEGDTYAPATDCDFLLHLHSERYDLNFYALRKFISPLADCLEIIDETHTFRYLDSRDFTGFIDGTENPQTDETRKEIAIIKDSECAGGSVVMLQRYVHDLAAWEPMSIKQQEKVIGRTKVDSVELATNEATSHLGRVDLKENGRGLKLLRHSLPYGTVSGEHGLLFISYSHDQSTPQTLLESMFGEKDGKTDQLLKFTKPVTGAFFYAPSMDALSLFNA